MRRALLCAVLLLVRVVLGVAGPMSIPASVFSPSSPALCVSYVVVLVLVLVCCVLCDVVCCVLLCCLCCFCVLCVQGFLLVRAHVDEVQGRKTFVNVSVTDGLHGKTYANGRALFVRPKWAMPPSIIVSATQ